MILMIGLDAYPYQWRSLLEERDYRVAELHSPHAMSAPAWTSIMTGLNAETHGVRGMYAKDWTAEAAACRPRYLWDHLTAADLESVVVNLPFSYPPALVRRLLVCGYPALPEHFTFPRHRQTDWEFGELDLYNRRRGLTHQEVLDLDEKAILEAHREARWALAHRFLLEIGRGKPDFAMFCLTDLDRLSHYASGAMRAEEVRNAVLTDILELVDRLEVQIAPEWLLLVSDHGVDLRKPTREDGWHVAHGPDLKESKRGVFAWRRADGAHLDRQNVAQKLRLEDITPTVLSLLDAAPISRVEGRPALFPVAPLDEQAQIQEALRGMGYVE